MAARSDLPTLIAEGHRLREAGRHGDAVVAYRAAVQRFPGSSDARHDLGGLLHLMGELDQAEQVLREAVDLNPASAAHRHSLAFPLLAQGRYAEGFALYEQRHLLPHLAPFKPALPFPEWKGEDLTGRALLIWPDQGLGDQIQNARFAPYLAAQGADVTLICGASLHRLFETSLDVRTIAAQGAIEFPDPDAWIMGMSLPGVLGLDPDTLPGSPYLQAQPVGAHGGRIGFVTQGDRRHANDGNRSLPNDAANRLRAVLGDAISLHPDASGARDFQDTADIIAGLDLVVTVDTSVAHLAGALGKPVWILLPAIGTDWRWMRGRSDSPWYPTARLFRQPAPGDWDAVIEAVAAALAER